MTTCWRFISARLICEANNVDVQAKPEIETTGFVTTLTADLVLLKTAVTCANNLLLLLHLRIRNTALHHATDNQWLHSRQLVRRLDSDKP